MPSAILWQRLTAEIEQIYCCITFKLHGDLLPSDCVQQIYSIPTANLLLYPVEKLYSRCLLKFYWYYSIWKNFALNLSQFVVFVVLQDTLSRFGCLSLERPSCVKVPRHEEIYDFENDRGNAKELNPYFKEMCSNYAKLFQAVPHS